MKAKQGRFQDRNTEQQAKDDRVLFRLVLVGSSNRNRDFIWFVPSPSLMRRANRNFVLTLLAIVTLRYGMASRGDGPEWETVVDMILLAGVALLLFKAIGAPKTVARWLVDLSDRASQRRAVFSIGSGISHDPMKKPAVAKRDRFLQKHARLLAHNGPKIAFHLRSRTGGASLVAACYIAAAWLITMLDWIAGGAWMWWLPLVLPWVVLGALTLPVVAGFGSLAPQFGEIAKAGEGGYRLYATALERGYVKVSERDIETVRDAMHDRCVGSRGYMHLLLMEVLIPIRRGRYGPSLSIVRARLGSRLARSFQRQEIEEGIELFAFALIAAIAPGAILLIAFSLLALATPYELALAATFWAGVSCVQCQREFAILRRTLRLRRHEFGHWIPPALVLSGSTRMALNARLPAKTRAIAVATYGTLLGTMLTIVVGLLGMDRGGTPDGRYLFDRCINQSCADPPAPLRLTINGDAG